MLFTAKKKNGLFFGRWVGGGVVATGGGVLGLQSTRWYLRKIPTDGGSCLKFFRHDTNFTGHFVLTIGERKRKKEHGIYFLLLTPFSSVIILK